MPIDKATINEIIRAAFESPSISVPKHIDSSENVNMQVLARVILRLSQEHPELMGFITNDVGTTIFADLLSRIIFEQEKPNPAEVAKIWAINLSPEALSKDKFANLENAATIFIEQIRTELGKELAQYTHAIETNPNANAYLKRGQFFRTVKNYSAALSDYQSAIRLDPKIANTIDTSSLLREAEMKQRAKKHLTDSVNRDYISKVNSIEQMNLSVAMKNSLLANLYAEFFGVIRPVDNLQAIIDFNKDVRTSVNNSVFIFIDALEENPDLSPYYLVHVVYPYIQQIVELQHLIDNIEKKPLSKVVIKSIQQNSPVSVSLDGASDAIQLINETVVPWRRKHAETMAQLLEQEKLADIELKKAEVLEKRAIAAKERELTGKLKIENEKLRTETALQQAKIQLATEIIMAITTNLNEGEIEVYITKLSPILDVLALGRLEILGDK